MINTPTYTELLQERALRSALISAGPLAANNNQVGGDHYKNKSIQPWDVMESWMGKDGFAFYLQGNVLKYISRYKEKNGLEDLKKAQHYLAKLIEIEGAA